MPKNKITITISGDTSSGKTRTARWLASVLKNMDMNVKLIDEGKESTIHQEITIETSDDLNIELLPMPPKEVLAQN